MGQAPPRLRDLRPLLARARGGASARARSGAARRGRRHAAGHVRAHHRAGTRAPRPFRALPPMFDPRQFTPQRGPGHTCTPSTGHAHQAMSALFSPRSNGIFRLVIAILVAGAAGTVGALMVFARVPAGTGQQEQVGQPVQFDHRHHVQDDLIDCRYCHTTVDKAAERRASRRPSSASTATRRSGTRARCSTWCARAGSRTGRSSGCASTALPDFVYFNHSIHVNKGVGCVECHGRVDLMPAIEQVAPLTMGWCLDCHRDPNPRLRPLEEITSMTWKPRGRPRRARAASSRRSTT